LTAAKHLLAQRGQERQALATTKKTAKTIKKPATAAAYETQLRAHQSDVELKKIQRYFKSGAGEYGAGDEFMGVRMGQMFALSQAFVDMPPSEIEKLLDSPIHEVRAGACSIMDKQARTKQTPASRRQELYALYFRRMGRINNWDLVDLAAHSGPSFRRAARVQPRDLVPCWAGQHAALARPSLPHLRRPGGHIPQLGAVNPLAPQSRLYRRRVGLGRRQQQRAGRNRGERV